VTNTDAITERPDTGITSTSLWQIRRLTSRGECPNGDCVISKNSFVPSTATPTIGYVIREKPFAAPMFRNRGAGDASFLYVNA
jgi:hypothetical protein